MGRAPENGTIFTIMARQRCPGCSKSYPAGAKFCPRCGHEASSAGAPGAGPLPSSSRMPLAGIVFIATAVLGPALIAAGVYTGLNALLVAGLGVAVVLIVLLVLGLFF